MMERRAFISELAVAAVLLPVAAHAQTPAKTRRVGVLMTTTPAAAAHVVAAFADFAERLRAVTRRQITASGRPPAPAPMVEW